MAKILIVDDSRVSRRMLRGILTKAGHEVIGEADNGQEGYEKFIELDPDIVTMDITMPVLDGLGALEKIMELNSEANIIMSRLPARKKKW